MDDSCLQAGSLLLHLIEFELMFFFFLSPNVATWVLCISTQSVAFCDYLMLFVSGFEKGFLVSNLLIRWLLKVAWIKKVNI